MVCLCMSVYVCVRAWVRTCLCVHTERRKVIQCGQYNVSKLFINKLIQTRTLLEIIKVLKQQNLQYIPTEIVREFHYSKQIAFVFSVPCFRQTMMAIPFLPTSHICQVFESLTTRDVKPITSAVDYVHCQTVDVQLDVYYGCLVAAPTMRQMPVWSLVVRACVCFLMLQNT